MGIAHGVTPIGIDLGDIMVAIGDTEIIGMDTLMGIMMVTLRALITTAMIITVITMDQEDLVIQVVTLVGPVRKEVLVTYTHRA